MYNILYVDSGMTGGGSTESLYQHLKYINRGKIKPYVALLNKNKYYNKFHSLNIECQIILDPLYNYRLHSTFPKLIRLMGLVKIGVDYCIPFFSIFWDWVYHYYSIIKLSQIVKKNNIHLIHSHNQPNRDLYIINCARLNNIPCISHIRSFNIKGFNKYKASHVNKYVGKFIAYSESIAECWIKAGIEKEKINIVHNSIEIPNIEPKLDLHGSFSIPNDRKIIGIIGELIKERGHKFLIKTFKHIYKVRKDIHLLIIGGGEQLNFLKHLVNEYSLASHVTFGGRVLNAKPIIASLDILVLPYSIEPFGRVLLEAWMLKTPVLLSNVGHIQKIVPNPSDILLFPYGNVELLLKAIFTLLDNDEIRKNMVEKAYEHCKENFSIKNYCDRIENIYMKALV